MSVERETLMAYVDGELTPVEAAKVAGQIDADPALAAYVAQQQALKARLKADFAAILSDPLPSRIENLILNAPVPNARKPARAPFAFSFSWLQAGALAAAVAAGILIAPLFGKSATIVSEGGRILAKGPLAQALSVALASEQTADQAIRIGVTFRNTSGAVCRSFAEVQSAGIACRDGGQWRVAALSAAEAANAGLYQPAASAMPPAVRDTMASLIDGAPFDAAAERAARDAGWR